MEKKLSIKEQIRLLLLRATKQRIILIQNKLSYSDCKLIDAISALSFLQVRWTPEIFWDWHDKKFNVIHQILTPKMRKIYTNLIKQRYEND